jgi:putative ABC transport system permease protein
VVIIPLQEKETRQKAEVIKTEFLRLSDVRGVSLSGGLPCRIKNSFRTPLENDRGEELFFWMRFDYVDYDYMDVFKIELVQGRNFSKEMGDDGDALLVNETFVEKMGWKEPVGKILPWLDKDRRVVGVVRDFHFDTLHREIEPMLLVLSKGGNMAVRIDSPDVSRTISSLKTVFERNTTSQPFDFYFLDDAFNRLYSKEQRTGRIFGAFSLLAVVIACMGLFGLAAFNVERRTKEIGIRRILGANGSRIVGLLTREFMLLVLLANFIAWPAAYLYVRRWMQNFSYRTDISLWMFVFAAAAALGIAFLTIGSQTLRAAHRNPAETLRYE